MPALVLSGHRSGFCWFFALPAAKFVVFVTNDYGTIGLQYNQFT
ncbi:Hypothetical protein ETEE_1286 [Edwardsiella anguillarum ET080813]|uniref:Uncharacterized protein n=1 Tax=Edwardsiella anguillarum ET080813 TaxID=667120 RepID=A0A076LGQ7_9GAMM|nr:Hypothetical protein ETEE_1286 [Edwardsiella anguillarum ET080813]